MIELKVYFDKDIESISEVSQNNINILMTMKGDTGEAGPKGDKGETGPKGDKGDPGERGPAGPKGDKGEPGKDGEQGPQGLTGPKGDKGDKGDGADIDLSEYVKKSDLRPGARYITMTAVIDQNNLDPLACITYEDDAKGMSKGSPEWDKFFGTKLILFKDGKEVRELKDEELNSLSPDDGDVMAKFSRKGLNIRTVDNKVYVSMTDNPNNPDFKYYAHSRGKEARNAFYLGAYLGYEQNGKLRSIKGVMPTSNKNIGNFRIIAQANGKGYEQLAFYQWTFLQALCILKYGNLNFNTTVGKGLTESDSSKTTGNTNGKGVDYGTSDGLEQMRFQYVEDMWGNYYQVLDGITTGKNNTMLTNTDNFNNEGKNYKSYSLGIDNDINGYIKTVQGNNELGFIAKTVTSSPSSYLDYQRIGDIAGGVACISIAYANGTKEGNLLFMFFDTVEVQCDEFTGTRLMFL